ncbi:hypothetical protein, partial [Salinimicrobium terrae]|uniref:hypothetical protein n=1 Tax=Salinimicrobium terrae TaxID=470866 RepID=UPI00055D5356
MRIFTLGKKGVPLLFFAFNLLIGSLPSYGQETCPSEGDIVANPFCYLQTVSSLTNGNYPVYQTDDNENDTQPIPGDELLTDGVTYYVGGPSGDCDRIAVTATVEVVERPTNTIFPNSPSFEITPCSSTNFTADDLADYFVAQPGYEIEVYTTEFGTTEAQGELVPDQSYFVGQVSTTNPDACPSLRAAVGYNPIDPNPPIATSPQVFCEGATVADLEAEGTYDNTQAIRWYRSMDANSPLPDNTQLINGQFYYASQIVNDRNDPFPPCESDERTAVFVEVQSIEAGEQIGDGIYCQSEIDNRLATTAPQQLVRELFTEQLESGVPTDGTFTNLSINEVISQYQSGVRSFSTTYTVTSEQGCEDSVELSFSIEEDFNAGEDNTTTTLCRSELPDTLTEEGAEGFFRSLLSENADANGTFSAQTIAEITAAFNSGDGTGTYSTTYSGGTGECADSAEIEVTVLEGGNAGDDADLVFCQSEIEALIAEFSADPTQNPEAFLAEWIGDRDTNGTFSGDPLTSIISQYQAGTWPIEVSTVYTIGAGTECEDSAQISLTVIEGDVVEDNSETICISDVPVLFQEIPEDVRAYFVDLAGGAEGGTFEPSIESLITQYGQNNLGDFRTVYTIGEGTSCEDSAELILTITDELPADAGDDRTLSFCTTEGPQDLAEFLTAGAMEDGTFSGDLDQTFDPATVGPGTYNVTYTVDDSSACVASGDQDTASFSITISEGENVVEDNSQTICITEVPVLFQEVPEDVRAYYVTLAGGVEGGTFEPSIEALIEQYGENNFGDFRTVYTVGEGTACEDSAELVVTIIDEQPAEAGDIAPQVVCSTDGMIDLSDYLAGSG